MLRSQTTYFLYGKSCYSSHQIPPGAANWNKAENEKVLVLLSLSPPSLSLAFSPSLFLSLSHS